MKTVNKIHFKLDCGNCFIYNSVPRVLKPNNNLCYIENIQNSCFHLFDNNGLSKILKNQKSR